MGSPLFGRGRGLSKWLEDLEKGDPVAIGLLGVFVAFLVGIALVSWYAKRKMDREDNAKKKKWNRS